MIDQQYNANLIRSKRIEYIDMAKGIGIMLVLLSHSISMNNFIAWANSFFMPLFFMCSGWCYRGPNSIQKRVKKILIPYYVWGGWVSYRNYFSSLYK